jgi:hypothetical protein
MWFVYKGNLCGGGGCGGGNYTLLFLLSIFFGFAFTFTLFYVLSSFLLSFLFKIIIIDFYCIKSVVKNQLNYLDLDYMRSKLHTIM